MSLKEVTNENVFDDGGGSIVLIPNKPGAIGKLMPTTCASQVCGMPKAERLDRATILRGRLIFAPPKHLANRLLKGCFTWWEMLHLLKPDHSLPREVLRTLPRIERP
jgi:hypothetical protein